MTEKEREISHLADSLASELNQGPPLGPSQAGEERSLGLSVQEGGAARLHCGHWRAEAQYELLPSQLQPRQDSPDLLEDLPALGGPGGHLGLMAVEQQAG